MEASGSDDIGTDADCRHCAVAAAEAGQRLDAVLARHHIDLSRTRLKALIESGVVSVSGKVTTTPSTKVTEGDALTVIVPPPEPATPRAEAIPLDILFEDGHLIVLNKPAGLVVHPGAGHRRGTLVNALLHHAKGQLSGIGGFARPGIVHRLDKDTSGVMVVAKTDLAHKALSRQFADHGRNGALERGYQALVWGQPRPARGRIEAAIGRDPNHSVRMAVRPDGKSAITHYETVRSFRAGGILDQVLVTVLNCRLETGRSHQIRVHCGHIGHPLLGDPIYGTGFRTKRAKLGEVARIALDILQGQALHAANLGFEHPVSGETLRFSSPPPHDMLALIETLEKDDRNTQK